MRVLLLFMPLACVLSAADTVVEVVVNHPVLNMHSKPDADSDVVSQALFGTNIQVLASAGGWSEIRTPDGYTGWADDGALLRREQPYAQSGSVAEVSSLFAHIYREPSVTRHRPILTLPFETRLELSGGADERWFEVKLPDQRTAWIQRGDVVIDPRPLASIDAVAALSRRFLGLPYTWGGTSSFGYDCSGFTQMLLRRRGIHMPRDAHQQEAWEKMLPVTDGVRTGDLLFFGPSREKITHTGMYIGGGEFIHATTRDRPVVQISPLSDPHWTAQLVSIRRAR